MTIAFVWLQHLRSYSMRMATAFAWLQHEHGFSMRMAAAQAHWGHGPDTSTSQSLGIHWREGQCVRFANLSLVRMGQGLACMGCTHFFL